MKHYSSAKPTPPHTNTDDQQYPHHPAGHYDEIKKIEAWRRRQQEQLPDRLNEQAMPKPASLPYLRRASHRR